MFLNNHSRRLVKPNTLSKLNLKHVIVRHRTTLSNGIKWKECSSNFGKIIYLDLHRCIKSKIFGYDHGQVWSSKLVLLFAFDQILKRILTKIRVLWKQPSIVKAFWERFIWTENRLMYLQEKHANKYRILFDRVLKDLAKRGFE